MFLVWNETGTFGAGFFALEIENKTITFKVYEKTLSTCSMPGIVSKRYSLYPITA